MRRIKLYLILAFMLAFIPSLEANDYYQFVANGIKYEFNAKRVSDGCYVIAGDEPYEGDIIIPESVVFEGIQLTVTRIFADAFRDCGRLTSIILPESVRHLGMNSFENCVSLASIILPKTQTIGECAFKDCINLTSIVLPEVTHIYDHAFENCISLEGIDSNNKIIYIDAYAFKGCVEFTEFSAPSRSVGDYAFEGCTALEKVNFPNLVQINEGTFDDCTSLKFENLYIPEVKTIYPAFKNSLINDKIILNGKINYLSRYGRHTFDGSGITSVDTGNKSVPDSLFFDFDSLREVTISNSYYLGKRCFANCDNIENVIFEDREVYTGITWVCGTTDNISGLNWMFWKHEKEPPYTSGMCTRPFSNSNVKNVTINRMLSGPLFGGILPIDGIPFPKDVKYTYGPGFTAFPPYYMQYAGLKKLEIPEHVTRIMAYACADNNFDEIVIPSQIDQIDLYAFINCGNVKKLIFEQSDNPISIQMTKLSELDSCSPFRGSSFEYVEIKRPIAKQEDVTEYYMNVSPFSKIRIKELKIPEGSTTLDMGTFMSVYITYIDVPESVDVIIMPHQLINIGDYNDISNLVVRNPIPPFIKEGGSFSDQINVYVPDSSVEAYKSNDHWGIYNILPLSEFSTKEMDDLWALGIDDIRNEETYFNYSVDRGMVKVADTDSASYEIYTLSGQLINRGKDDYQLPTKGIYLLKSGHSSIKIVY